MSNDPRLPIGEFEYIEPSEKVRKACIAQYREAPSRLREALKGLTTHQLLSRYRPEGWTLAQVVHHLAEADANAYPRLKYALTETVPPNVMVSPQELWAELPDAKSVEIAATVAMFEGIRIRWAEAWESLYDEDFHRQWRHSSLGLLTLDHLLQQYAWHARHHTAQITSHKTKMGW
jgi:uncharacterized damage-inducible protein DinB